MMLYIRYYKFYVVIYAHMGYVCTKCYGEQLRFFYGGPYWLKYNLDAKCLASLGSKIVWYIELSLVFNFPEQRT